MKSDKNMEQKSTKRYLSDSSEAAFVDQRNKIKEKLSQQLKVEIDKLPKSDVKSIEYFHKIADIYSTRLDEITKFKEKGGKVVGMLCALAPPEPISALGAIPIRLCSGEAECSQRAQDLIGDAGLCPLAKSLISGSLSRASPYIEISDLVAAPTPCDAKLKVSEIMADNVPVVTMNTPRTKTDLARKQWVNEIKILIEAVEKLTGRKLKLNNLKDAVHKYQEAQIAWHELSELRKKANVLWGRDALLIAELTFIDEIVRWTKNVENLTKELEIKFKNKEFVCSEDSPRIMIGGSPIVWPNWKVPDLIEELGAIIVCDELCTGSRILSNPTVVEELTYNAIIDAVADRYLYPCTCPCFTPNLEREDNFLRKIKEYKVDGVVFHVLKGCHLNAIDATKIKRFLKQYDIPILILDSDYGDGDMGQLKIRIEAFLEMVRAGKEESLFPED